MQFDQYSFAEGSQLETLYSDPANGGPFRGCNSVNTIEIPASVTDLNLDEIAETQLSGQGFTGERFLGVFDGWTNAKNVTFAEGSQFDCEGGVIYDGETLIVSLDDEIESVIVRDGTSKIGDDAFFMCSKLKTVTLPDGLISIGDNAFNIAPNIDVILPSIPGLPQPQGSSQANILEQINVPATVTNIGDNFLKGALKTDGSSVVIMQGDTPPSFGEGAFATKDQAAQLKLYYPSEAEDAYTAEGSPLAEIINSSSDEDDSSYDYRLSLEDKQLGINDTIQFEVILPNGANLTVNSSDQSIATVSDSDGKIMITGLSVGTTTISAKIELNGYEMVSDQCEVTVSPYIPPVPSYLITLPDLDNGTVTSDRATARQGATVTLTVTPEDGYTLDEISVTDFFGNAVEVVPNADGTYSFVMPYSQVEVSATFARTEEPIVFTDVPEGAYYYDPVYWAVANGITDGTSDTEFSPGRTVTRGEMVTFLWRAAGSPQPATSVNPFEDVSSSAYYYDAVLWAVENGITDGVSDTRFDPDGQCTRAQMVTFLWRAAGQPDAGTSNPFEDVSAEAYYYEAVLWAAENGVTDGTSDTQFSPEGDCTRAQAVTFLYRAR